MNKDEALKLALEALKRYQIKRQDFDTFAEAIAAIKEALAQPAQELVAWMNPSWIDPDTRGWQSDSFESIPIEGWLPIYTTPPQRTWVELTDEEISNLWSWSMTREAELTATTQQHAFARAIEAKLKEHNA
jgi:hypothetical protein